MPVGKSRSITQTLQAYSHKYTKSQNILKLHAILYHLHKDTVCVVDTFQDFLIA